MRPHGVNWRPGRVNRFCWKGAVVLDEPQESSPVDHQM